MAKLIAATRIRRGRTGASLVEYALLVALIAVVAVTAVTLLGTSEHPGSTASRPRSAAERGTTVTGLRRKVMIRLLAAAKKFVVAEEGASLVEYALLVATIAVVAVTAVTLLGINVSTLFNTAATSVGSSLKPSTRHPGPGRPRRESSACRIPRLSSIFINILSIIITSCKSDPRRGESPHRGQLGTGPRDPSRRFESCPRRPGPSGHRCSSEAP